MSKIAYDVKPFKIFMDTLSNSNRFRMVMSLKKPKNVSQICSELKLNQTTVSHNLQRLLDCGFVFYRRNGKEKIFSLNKETILPLVKLIESHTHCYCSKLCHCKMHGGQ